MGKAVARALIMPTVQGAHTAQRFAVVVDSPPELKDFVNALREQTASTVKGDLARFEAMLATHAHTLDGIYNNLARRAAANAGEYVNAAEVYMRLALRAQAQCRATVETIHLMKYPTPVAFVRQTNIAAGPQQVNNGTRADERTSPQNELLERSNAQGVEPVATGITGSPDPRVEALGAINRPADHRG